MTTQVTDQAVSQSAEQKTKTKAKQRYLKAKKERRKKRKSVVGQITGVPSSDQAAERSEEEDLDEGDADGAKPPAEEREVVDEVEKQSRKNEGDKRAKKRRKVEVPAPETEEPMDEAADEVEAVKDVGTEGPERRSTPQAALPVFPMPKQPDAPSKSTLALQGLDNALAEAEWVDSQTTVSLSGGSAEARMGVSDKMRERLKELGILELFAVQTAVIPFLLSDPKQASLYLPYTPPRDICVTAPTGSGKTLAYVVPIVEILALRVVTRLRALVVLPTRDLVVQVRETLEAVGKGRGLKIGIATGQHSFAHEQAQLVADKSIDLQGGSSKIDILICTPGRLIDHLNGTPNFSLQHLRFLVVDEADRLLAQSYQNWLSQVLAATQPPASPADGAHDPTGPLSTDGDIAHPDALAPAFLHQLRVTPFIQTDLYERKRSSCQKMLFSATLTRDPAKLAALNLTDPKYFVVQGRSQDKQEGVLNLVMEKFSMPATLKEHFLVCESSQKPLHLFYLVHQLGVRNALVFTKSAESTTRLVRLFEFFESSGSASSGSPAVACAYSSDLPAGERATILEKFKNQEIQILICSDLISRGIDISHVSHVVSYDAPVDIRKYVHRVGRTARAGREGDAWTLVEEQEARYFKDMMKNADRIDAVKRVKVSEKELSPLVPDYEQALEKLKEAYARSKN